MKHLFIVAHPDDEILASYGTIKELIKNGDEVAVAIFSGNIQTRENDIKEKAIKIHKAIGIQSTIIFSYEAMRFDKYERYKLTRDVEHVIKAEEPDFIYTHDWNDIHNDHRVLSQIVIEASKYPQRGIGYDKTIRGLYCMEVPSSTDWGYGFIPNTFVEISKDSIDEKTSALKVYDDVIRECPHSRNYETFMALARYRGAQCGVMYAEAYRKIMGVGI